MDRKAKFPSRNLPTDVGRLLQILLLLAASILAQWTCWYYPQCCKGRDNVINRIWKLSCVHATSLQMRADYFKFCFYGWSDVWSTVMTSKLKIFGSFCICMLCSGRFILVESVNWLEKMLTRPKAQNSRGGENEQYFKAICSNHHKTYNYEFSAPKTKLGWPKLSIRQINIV